MSSVTDGKGAFPGCGPPKGAAKMSNRDDPDRSARPWVLLKRATVTATPRTERRADGSFSYAPCVDRVDASMHQRAHALTHPCINAPRVTAGIRPSPGPVPARRARSDAISERGRPASETRGRPRERGEGGIAVELPPR